jgi:hypothetical protein
MAAPIPMSTGRSGHRPKSAVTDRLPRQRDTKVTAANSGSHRAAWATTNPTAELELIPTAGPQTATARLAPNAPTTPTAAAPRPG